MKNTVKFFGAPLLCAIMLAVAAGFLVTGCPAGATDDTEDTQDTGKPSDTNVVPVTFTGLTADGSATVTTTKLILTFDKDITGLSAADITLSAGSTGASKETLTRTGTGVYELAVSAISAGGSVTVAVSKSGYAVTGGPKQVTVYRKIITFTVDPIPAQTYTGSPIRPDIVVKDGTTTLTLTADYTATYANNTNPGTATVTITGAGNYAGSSGNTVFTITKAAGAIISTPTLNTRTHNSITINAVSVPSTGQSVEYGISISNIAPSTGWQTTTTFSGLYAGITYYVFARSVSNDNYNTGTASESLEVTTLQIINAEIIVTAPVKGSTPHTTASSVDDIGNFTMGPVLWSPVNNPFLGNTVYTATVTLTANSGYTFTGMNNATINGQNAVVSNNTGAAVTLSRTFPATDEKAVTTIAIKTPPTKLTYTHGDMLDLTGLVVTLIHDDTTTEDVATANFTSKNITTNPSQGNHLAHITHNGHPVTVTYGDLTPLNIGNLTVNPKVITFTVDAIPAQTYTGSAIQPAAMVKDGTAILTAADYTEAYSNNINVGTATVTISGAGNYAGSTGSRTFTITPRVITFTVDTISAQTYTGSTIQPEVIVRDGTAILTAADYTEAYSNNINAGTATVTISGAGNYAGSSGSGTFTIIKAIGTAVSAPTLNTRTHNSITVNAVSVPGTGQSVEYGINTDNTAPSSGWQISTIFTGLNVGTTYYIFARAASNGNYEAGAASSSLAVTTVGTVSEDKFEYYWVDQLGSLVTTSGGATTVASGVTLIITAQSTGYTVKQWRLNGVNTGQNGNTYNFSSTTAGQHTVGLFVEKDGNLYNTNITITVVQ